MMDSRVKYSRVRSRREYRRSFENFLIITLAVVLLLRLFVLNSTYVTGISMRPTLVEGQQVLVFKAAYTFSDPKRFDVVVCQFPGEDEKYVKRVIGLPGETVELRGDETIYIDGEPLEGDIYGSGANPRIKSWQVPANSYFLMGDNRAHSSDSSVRGPLDEDAIMGKAFAVIWPVWSIKLL